MRLIHGLGGLWLNRWNRLGRGRCRIGRFLVIVHGFAKALDRLADVSAEVFQLLGAEHQYDNNQNDDPVFPVKNAHVAAPL
ncbi:hypothetical protein D3C78_1889380 [compost metagenome]